MSSEKSPALIHTKNIPFEEANKQKICSKTLLTCILATILVGLCIILTIEFLYPFQKNHLSNDKGGPWQLDFLINPTRLCETVDSEVQLLILVPSANAHFRQREAIRRTWGSVAQQGGVRLAFVLGIAPNSTEVGAMVEAESGEWGDIIQADFDEERDLTARKSVLMLKWTSEHCPHARYFLKADDDTFVNLRQVARILQKDPYARGEENFISGHIITTQQQSEDLPAYASGPAYLSTGRAASRLYEAACSLLSSLVEDDVFVTGLCAEDIHAMLLHEPSFLYRDPPKSITSYRMHAASHSLTPDEMEEIWKEIGDPFFNGIIPAARPEVLPSAKNQLKKEPA